MDFPVTIDDQASFDALVKDRLAREKTKLDEAVSRAEEAEASIAAVAQERDEAVARATSAEERATDAEGKVQTFESQKQLNELRTEVAKAAGVPATALRGTTKEELEAHASELKPLITASRGPVIPGQGDVPETKTDTAAAADREFADFLTGHHSAD